MWPEPGDGVPARAPTAPRARDSGASRNVARPPYLADRVVTTAELARLAADQCPDAAAEAPDWFLGPWADILTSSDAAVLQAALANHALTERDGATSAELWGRDVPASDRAAVRAAARAPLALWRIAELQGPLAIVEDLVGLAVGWTPEGAARIEGGGGALGPPRAGGTLLARAVRTRAGWLLVTPLALPTRLPAAACARQLERLLALDPSAPLETALARHGALLSRAAHSHAWRSA